MAPRVAAAAASHLDGSFAIHLSGCVKGCAHSGPAALTIVGTADGCAVVANGNTRDSPLAIVPADELPGAVARLAPRIKREAGHV
jgi:precorrin-3B synthase